MLSRIKKAFRGITNDDGPKNSNASTAVCFYGGFSRLTDSQSNLATREFSINARDTCINSVLSSCPQDIDIFIHSWADWPAPDMPKICDKKIEDNQHYQAEILDLLRSKFRLPNLSADTHPFNIYFNQISASLSRQKSIELMEAHMLRTNQSYKKVILVRPDVFITKTINVEPKENEIICNNSPGSSWGDFRFILKPELTWVFKSCYLDICPEFPPIPHYFIPNYLFRCGVRLTQDDVLAGPQEDVFRKLSIAAADWGIPISMYQDAGFDSNLLAQIGMPNSNRKNVATAIYREIADRYVDRFLSIENYIKYRLATLRTMNTIFNSDERQTIDATFAGDDLFLARILLSGYLFRNKYLQEACSIFEDCLEQAIPKESVLLQVANSIIDATEQYKMVSATCDTDDFQACLALLKAVPTMYLTDDRIAILNLQIESLKYVLDNNR